MSLRGETQKLKFKMIKKYLLVILLPSVIVSAKAESLFDGFYEQIGVGFNKTNFNLSTTPLSVSTNNFATTASIGNSTNISGAFTAGYLKKIKDNFLLGLSVDAHPFESPSTAYGVSIATRPSASTVVGSFQNQSNFTISLIPAIEISPNALAYLKLGYVWGSVQKNYTVTTPASINTVNQSVNLSGTAIGVGYKRFISDQMYGFTEMNYVHKNDFTQQNTVTIANTTANYSATSGGYYVNALIGLGYQF